MSANKYYATVTRVIDGDTFEIKDKFGKSQTIRLFGIDTPEKKQTFGMTAKAYTEKLIDKKEVFVESVELGRYNRVVAVVYVNGHSLAESLLADGIAFAAGDSHPLATKYYSLQERARVNNRGVHKLGIISPAEFRRKNQRYRDPTLRKSSPRHIPQLAERFIPARPSSLILEKVKKFFSDLFTQSPEQIAKKEAIKKAEQERIKKRIEDRKMEESLKENLKDLEKIKKEVPMKKPESTFLKRFNERTKHM